MQESEINKMLGEKKKQQQQLSATVIWSATFSKFIIWRINAYNFQEYDNYAQMAIKLAK